VGFYQYRAALLCEDCGEAQRSALRGTPAEAEAREAAEHGGTCSETWPAGPYPTAQGETDTPDHCDACRVYLRLPLTSDGWRYVAEALRDFVRYAEGDAATLRAWAEHARDVGAFRRGMAAAYVGAAAALLDAPAEAPGPPPRLTPGREYAAHAWAQRSAAWERAERFRATRERFARWHAERVERLGEALARLR
jgi:hypothetical protein